MTSNENEYPTSLSDMLLVVHTEMAYVYGNWKIKPLTDNETIKDVLNTNINAYTWVLRTCIYTLTNI